MDEPRRNESSGGPPPWMLSLADLISLLLTFFVMLFAMSTVKVDKWDEMIDSLNQTISPVRKDPDDTPTSQVNISTTYRKPAKSLDYLNAILTDNLKDDPILQQAELTRTEEKLVVSLPGDVLFLPGLAELNDRARGALFSLGGVLRNIGNKLGVEGHSDPTPLSGRGAYVSNWELSLARAAAVANQLRRSGYTRNINVYGFADSRYDEVPSYLPQEERYRRARRVDIIIAPHSGFGFGDF